MSLVALAACSNNGIDKNSEFSGAPSSCADSAEVARQEILNFVGDLYSESVSFNSSGEVEGSSSSRRCFAAYTDSESRWDISDADLNNPQQRSVNFYFMINVGDENSLGTRTERTRRVFEQNKPSDSVDCAGIGDDCYIVSETRNGSCTTALKFRTGNLIFQIQLGTSTYERLKPPLGYESSSEASVRAIASAFASNLENLIPM
ncbi:hypothetical protein [Nocardia lasii]|uniref:DUF3558 domain-containing protein n=1 Tax=Nocardia lasii TaxID=1616107 RepID=A0ABW1JRD7_9NOCA